VKDELGNTCNSEAESKTRILSEVSSMTIKISPDKYSTSGVSTAELVKKVTESAGFKEKIAAATGLTILSTQTFVQAPDVEP